MDQSARLPAGAKSLMIAAALVIVVAGIDAAEAVLIPFFVSIFLAVICAPPVFWLQRRRVPSAIAVLLVMGGVVGIGASMAGLVASSVNTFSQRLPIYQDRLQGEAQGLLTWLESVGVTLSSDLLLEYVDPGAAMRMAANMLSQLGSVFANAFLILLTVIFILLEVSSFPAKWRTAVGAPAAAVPGFAKFTAGVKRYLAIKTGVSLATGVLIAGWVWFLDVDFPLLWGLLAFLLNFVPNLGSIIAAAPTVLLAFIQHGLGTAAFVAAGYAAVNVVMGNVIEPRFMGRGLGLSTLVVFLSLVFWGWLLGPVGMLLSVPLTMTVKIALEANDDTRWIAVLLGADGSAEAAAPDPAPASEAAAEAGAVPSPTVGDAASETRP